MSTPSWLLSGAAVAPVAGIMTAMRRCRMPITVAAETRPVLAVLVLMLLAVMCGRRAMRRETVVPTGQERRFTPLHLNSTNCVCKTMPMP